MLSHVCFRLAIDFVVIVMVNFYFVFVKKQRKMLTERKVKLKKRIRTKKMTKNKVMMFQAVTMT